MHFSPVETKFIEKSGRQPQYPLERLPAVEVENVYELGKLVAVRFLEWVQQNPKGVVALPTGRTPEYFIKTLAQYKQNWAQAEVREELQALGFQAQEFPDTSGIHFVMLDEFFPMHPSHKHSFVMYIKNFYLPLFNIAPENVLTFDLLAEGVVTEAEMEGFGDEPCDLALLTQEPKDEKEAYRKDILQRLQQYCDRYEERIAALGGIGFFLGGIGPDGHIAFNMKGSAHDSRTRLVQLNYPTAAQSASDLGGIELARDKTSMTIGLATITSNPDAVIIIMAAGEGKAKVIRNAMEEGVSTDYPASSLHSHAGARLYLTHGSACLLTARRAEDVARVQQPSAEWLGRWIDNPQEETVAVMAPTGLAENSCIPGLPIPEGFDVIERVLCDTSLRCGKRVDELTTGDFGANLIESSLPQWVHERLEAVSRFVRTRLIWKLEQGLRVPTNTRFMHTAPHHDDIMLSYHAMIHALLDEKRTGNGNSFVYLTSGFHSVTDSFLKTLLNHTTRGQDGSDAEHIAWAKQRVVEPYDDLLATFKTAVEQRDEEAQDQIECVMLLRQIAEVYGIEKSENISVDALATELAKKVHYLQTEYLPHRKHGDATPVDLQKLKGCMRETECDRLWALSSMPNARVHHMRSNFYTDDFFTPMPTVEHDAQPLAELMHEQQPHVVTVAFDPEGTGPDTHYKVLLVVAQAIRLQLAKPDKQVTPVVWGYRNVWFRFHPTDATLLAPVSAEALEQMHVAFMACFTTQKFASFPSPDFDGPFSEWSRQTQMDQRRIMGVLLGEPFFANHEDERMRNSAGFVYLKSMDVDTFLQGVEELKSRIQM